MFAQKLLPALAVFGLAAAQTASVCSQATATVNSAADATALADCATISGDILIGTSASGVISIDGPQQVTGNFICLNAGQLTTLSSKTISTIGGSFQLANLTLLSTLSFGSLASVNTIDWSALPALPGITFPSTFSQATSVTITNTFLSSLEGLNNLQTVATLNINNNNRLKAFTTAISNVTSALSFAANGDSLSLSFPDLVWAANVTFRNASSVDIPSLAYVNGSLGFYGNSLSNVTAPNLTTVGYTTGNDRAGGLAFVDNDSLANITMPLLKAVGGAFQISTNSPLPGISFPNLAQVSGAISFSGNFSSASLPALANVQGGFNLTSTTSLDCTAFKADDKSGVIQGAFTCVSIVNGQSVGTSTTGTSTGSSASSTSTKGAAASYGISEAAAGLSVLGGLLQMLL
ncbi:hypothetical protein G7Y89_g12928 [Cudoniella acicularis]|uniref:Uncharacterized protein n=1 Tax=Cudoniella acicularis TaxID=354080 RepID=A0A8H4R9H4_9HELO|nr:hypothetical protein G7Y89_g12928 [Cudoniella acicularis]